MKKFIIEDEFWNLFPNARIGVITCHGIDNTIKDKYKGYFFMYWISRWKKVKEFKNALKDLSKLVQDNLGGTCSLSILDINNK